MNTFLDNLGIYWNSKSVSSFDNVDLVYYSLQFYYNGWIYNYRLYCRDKKFPMYIVKENQAVKVNNIEEFKQIIRMIENRDDSFFNLHCEQKGIKSDRETITKMVKEDKNILCADESSVFDNVWYIKLLK